MSNYESRRGESGNHRSSDNRENSGGYRRPDGGHFESSGRRDDSRRGEQRNEADHRGHRDGNNDRGQHQTSQRGANSFRDEHDHRNHGHQGDRDRHGSHDDRSKGNYDDRSRGNQDDRYRGNNDDRSRGNNDDRYRGNNDDRSRGNQEDRYRSGNNDERSRQNRDEHGSSRDERRYGNEEDRRGFQEDRNRQESHNRSSYNNGRDTGYGGGNRMGDDHRPHQSYNSSRQDREDRDQRGNSRNDFNDQRSSYPRGNGDYERNNDKNSSRNYENHGYQSAAPRYNQGSNDRYQNQNDHGSYNQNSNSNSQYNGGQRQEFGNNQHGREYNNRGNDFNRREGGFRNENGFGNQGNDYQRQEPRRFDNDGGYSSAQGNQQSYQNEVRERAPRDWVPEELDVEENMRNVALDVADNEIKDQEIEIRNSDVDTRLTSWDNSGLDPQILANLERMKYTSVRAIQAAMIPQIMKGYDVIGQAETSAGKTAAFGLPIVNYCLTVDEDTRAQARSETAPFGLILAPTRELAQQIYQSLQTYSRGTNVRCCLSYGEIARYHSYNQIREGCDILIGTCGRIMDFVQKGDISLARLKFFVLDEADRLLQDKQRDPVGHLGIILDDFGFKSTDGSRQTLMTSATFDNAVNEVARTLMKPIEGENDIVRIVLAKGRLSNRVKIEFHNLHGRSTKIPKLTALLKEKNDKDEVPKTLIFVQQKKFCDQLALNIVNLGHSTQTLHGDRPQDKRDELIRKFKSGEVNILVTTDVLSRGIDVRDLERVINFDMPEGTPESAIDTFIHRSGRTGRLHGGVCHAFIDPNSENDRRMAHGLVELLKTQDEPDIPDFLIEMARNNPVSSSGANGGFGSNSRGNNNFGGNRNNSGFGGSGFSAASNGFPASSGSGFPASTGSGFPPTADSGFPSGGFGAAETPKTVGGGFGAAKTPSGFNSSAAAEETNESEEAPRGYGSKAAVDAKTGFGSSSFGNGENKKESDGEEDDDDW